MIIIEEASTFTIHSNEIKTHEKLPKGFYTVCFSKMMGFYLKKEKPFTINEKLYGDTPHKAKHIIKSFEKFERNCGVILSGNKGIGKTLCAKQICINAYNENYPILIVDQAFGGLTNFINSIQQEIVVLFDEFDKTFGYQDESKNINIQDDLLPLFDGTFTSKKLFIITCNSIYKLNEFLINRPGRFHYHIRFKQLNNDDIEEYLKDHLEPDFYDEIPTVIGFSNRTPITYDCLRAISFELNLGRKFREFINDLNILDSEDYQYDVYVTYKDNNSKLITNTYLSDEDVEKYYSFYTSNGMNACTMTYYTKDLTLKNNVLYIDKEKLTFRFNTTNAHRFTKEDEAEAKEIKKQVEQISGLVFKLKQHNNYNFVF